MGCNKLVTTERQINISGILNGAVFLVYTRKNSLLISRVPVALCSLLKTQADIFTSFIDKLKITKNSYVYCITHKGTECTDSLLNR